MGELHYHRCGPTTENVYVGIVYYRVTVNPINKIGITPIQLCSLKMIHSFSGANDRVRHTLLAALKVLGQTDLRGQRGESSMGGYSALSFLVYTAESQ